MKFLQFPVRNNKNNVKKIYIYYSMDLTLVMKILQQNIIFCETCIV